MITLTKSMKQWMGGVIYLVVIDMLQLYLSIYIHILTRIHTHTHIYIYIYNYYSNYRFILLFLFYNILHCWHLASPDCQDCQLPDLPDCWPAESFKLKKTRLNFLSHHNLKWFYFENPKISIFGMLCSFQIYQISTLLL